MAKQLDVADLSLTQLWELVLMGQMPEARYWEIHRSRTSKPKLRLVVDNT